MLMMGKKIFHHNDPLTKVEIKFVYDKIRNPDVTIREKIDALRSMATLNPAEYRREKKLLPYVVPSVFRPPYRRRENFVYSEYLILDFDHLHHKGIAPDKLKDRLSSDPRVMLVFISPSGDGLKVFFRLNPKIQDYSLYSKFYKIFATQFATQYQIEQIVDNKTSDVTRACFFSYDMYAYFNPKAQTIDYRQYADFENSLEILLIEDQIDKQQQQKKQALPASLQDRGEEKIDPEVIIQIKQKLNPNYRPPIAKKKRIVVPPELDEAEKVIREAFEGSEIELASVKNINYGKQFLFKYQGRYAEINLYFSPKRGFTVVKTTKTINDQSFQDSIAEIFYQIYYRENPTIKI